MEKWGNLVILLLIIAVIFILWRMSKVVQLQNTTLLSIANKLGIENQIEEKAEECEECQEDHSEEEEESEEYEEEETEDDTHHARQTNPQSTQVHPVKVVKPKHDVPSEPKVKRTQIFMAILDLFNDGKPRKRKDIEEQLWTSNYFNVPANKIVKTHVESKGSGYLGDVIQKMKSKSILGSEYIDLGDKWKSYYYFGLPEWFDNGKMKPEFAEKVGFKTNHVEDAEVIEDQTSENTNS